MDNQTSQFARSWTKPKQRKGFATFTAITLLIIVSIALQALAIFAASEARRTRTTADQAQVQQLLFAGRQVALRHLQNGSPLTIEVPIPTTTLTVEPTTPGDFDVSATVNNLHASQHLHFTHPDSGWVLDSAELKP